MLTSHLEATRGILARNTPFPHLKHSLFDVADTAMHRKIPRVVKFLIPHRFESAKSTGRRATIVWQAALEPGAIDSAIQPPASPPTRTHPSKSPAERTTQLTELRKKPLTILALTMRAESKINSLPSPTLVGQWTSSAEWLLLGPDRGECRASMPLWPSLYLALGKGTKS